MIWPTPSVMHVQALRRAPSTGPLCRKLTLSESSYRRLVDALRSGFATDERGGCRLIEGAGYGRRDAFYEGVGSYHALWTCNNWANQVLKTAGIRTALWSPLPSPILWHVARERFR